MSESVESGVFVNVSLMNREVGAQAMSSKTEKVQRIFHQNKEILVCSVFAYDFTKIDMYIFDI